MNFHEYNQSLAVYNQVLGNQKIVDAECLHKLPVTSGLVSTPLLSRKPIKSETRKYLFGLTVSGITTKREKPFGELLGKKLNQKGSRFYL